MKQYTIASLTALLLVICVSLHAQVDTDVESFQVKAIYDEVLTHAECYEWLRGLTKDVGPRLSGSPGGAAGVEYMKQIMDTLGFDTVWLQECQVPHWSRGPKPEVARIVNSSLLGTQDLICTALGNSESSVSTGFSAPVIEVHSLDEVDERAAEVKGKIVFYNRPMDPKQLRTFYAYGGAVDQRGAGASRASKHGALGVLVRSMTTEIDDVPHTGGMWYDDGVEKIPALAIATSSAELLSEALGADPDLQIYMRSDAKMLSDKTSYNVIGQINGTETPENILLVGGHLDSWDLGEGAHDDGAGCVHSLEVIRTMKALGLSPKNTLRCVLFANEENGLQGGRKYAEVSNAKGEFHMAALESDAGGFTPRGFSLDGDRSVFERKLSKVREFNDILQPYGLSISVGGSGADISPLKSQKGLLIGFRPDSQRYFDYHHTAEDRFEAVNKRELELGAAAMTSLIYLIDKYGL